MNEISGCVLNFLTNQAKEKAIANYPTESHNDDDWYSFQTFEDRLNTFASASNKLVYKELGEKFYFFASEKNLIEDEENVKTAVINVHKLYTQTVRGDGIGIWKTNAVTEGHAKIEENTVLPELFTEGMLRGLLKKHQCVGVLVKQLKSRDDDENYFNEFELTWMRKVK